MIQKLKVIIWGLGTNGKNLIDLLGPESILAIIDSSKDKLAMGTFQNIPIINFDTYFTQYREEILVITAMNYHDIVEKLKKHGIKKYFVLNKSKVAIAALGFIRTDQFVRTFKLNDDRNYCISGVNLFSLYLYHYLKEYNRNVDFLLSDPDQKELLDILVKEKIVNGYITETDDLKNALVIKTDDVIVEESRNIRIIDYEYMNKTIYQSWKKELERFKNCHYGKRIFIVATGPSIRVEDLEKLKDSHELTISMNGIIYFLEKTTWRPDYYVISDGEMIRTYETELEREKYLRNTEKFFSDNYLKFWEKKHDSTYHGFRQIQKPYEIEFSNDFSEQVYAGYTVVYSCIQLAVYMGIKEIYLLGCDFSFSQDMKAQNNHCYRKKVEFYTFNFDGALKGYLCAKKYADENGLKIYNATRGGKLEVFERVDFDSLFL